MSQDEIAEVKRRIDIVDLIGVRLPLRRSGRYHWGCCPFHREKTASMAVNPEKQSFHCYGCGVHGDVFSFIMEYDRLDSPQALKLLADQAGVKLNDNPGPSTERKKRLLHLREALEAALSFYREQLRSNEGRAAREYMQGRNFMDSTLERFEIGYAPQGHQLLQYAEKRGLSKEVLIEAGLAGRGESGRTFDFFRERVMFPVRDGNGELVGFGGRVLGKGEPKYLNSPETTIFLKRSLFYNFHHARELFRDHRHFLIMEGYTDVMMVDQVRAGPAIATLGTALGDEHARILKRQGAPVYLVFDADKAGLSAADRTLPVLLKHGVQAKVIRLPHGKDPCEFLSAEGPQAAQSWAELRNGAGDLFTDKLNRALSGAGDAHEKAAAAHLLLGDLKQCGDRLLSATLLQQLSKATGIRQDLLDSDLSREPPPPKAVPDLPMPTRSIAKPSDKASYRSDPCFHLFAFLLADPHYVTDFLERNGNTPLPSSLAGKVLKTFLDQCSHESGAVLPLLEAQLDENARSIVGDALALELPPSGSHDFHNMYQEYLAALQSPQFRLTTLLKAIREASDPELKARLQNEHRKLQQEIRGNKS
ncbi:MAG: DNA primase [Planctomycetes bacterium]|nr:DNA primase [Planctomycetota bacterium]